MKEAINAIKTYNDLAQLNSEVQSFLNSLNNINLAERSKLEALEIKFKIIQETLLDVNNPLEDFDFKEFVVSYFKAFQELKSSLDNK
ncbi:MAG: hypothetical protein IPO16_08870 [Saprospiraceae bacterium]|nr:hypothetical protein [Saprospiraceae bacterium]